MPSYTPHPLQKAQPTYYHHQPELSKENYSAHLSMDTDFEL